MTAGFTSLPIAKWPTADRLAWDAACQPGARLKRGGAAAHLKEVTRKDLARRYGYFLSFVEWSEGLDAQGSVAAYVTPHRVACYVAELQKRVGSVTVQGSIYKLRRTAQLLNPAGDVRWLCDLEKDLALEVQPHSKFGRLVYSNVLLEAGLTLMAEAHSIMVCTELKRARQVRNGLMIALLACHPIRLKNFAGLELGRTIRKVADDWWIVLPDRETKEARHDERKVDPCLQRWIDLYVEFYRPTLTREDRLHHFLWSSSNGDAMTYASIEKVIKATTLETIGVDVCPHLFRTAAASTVATSAPDLPGLAASLLHHTSATVTEEHYNRAKSSSAAQAFGALLRQVSSGSA
ncbi:MAG: site-specific integrase [Rhodoplanes sp.]|uniref:tyrosine-type recombinase/integrase n=1 Tax=Rhodoplanes sp. TaxID=1968906 RepID=UPI00184DBAD7|nr:tyrosine-type recombinase/integrase [Rhodoplanes sp.]NVO13604.1 site-specific integrase [Rhodoplanes sp.]